ncbi:MAG: acylphosphatase, partial [Dehalococcoidia bacterium]|nr:acylphosphatase [Dehalococcoidia bacterium]
MSDVEGIHAYIHGRVQGVLFRDFVKKAARPLSLTGFVRNLPDGETV